MRFRPSGTYGFQPSGLFGIPDLCTPIPLDNKHSRSQTSFPIQMESIPDCASKFHWTTSSLAFKLHFLSKWSPSQIVHPNSTGQQALSHSNFISYPNGVSSRWCTPIPLDNKLSCGQTSFPIQMESIPDCAPQFLWTTSSLAVKLHFLSKWSPSQIVHPDFSGEQVLSRSNFISYPNGVHPRLCIPISLVNKFPRGQTSLPIQMESLPDCASRFLWRTSSLAAKLPFPSKWPLWRRPDENSNDSGEQIFPRLNFLSFNNKEALRYAFLNFEGPAGETRSGILCSRASGRATRHYLVVPLHQTCWIINLSPNCFDADRQSSQNLRSGH